MRVSLCGSLIAFEIYSSVSIMFEIYNRVSIIYE